jgi:hypothetical protein
MQISLQDETAAMRGSWVDGITGRVLRLDEGMAGVPLL